MRRPSRVFLRSSLLLLGIALCLFIIAAQRMPWRVWAAQAREAVADVQDTLRGAAAGGTPAAGEIAVYFAPDTSMAPGGIDDAFLTLLSSARTSIFLAAYDLELEAAGDMLVRRHNDGIKVAIVSDSHYRDREAVQACLRAGIPVVFDERDPFMHDKFCIVDGEQVWTGSTNITYNCMYRNNNNAILIASRALADDYTAEFLEMFDRHGFGGRSPRNTPNPVVTVGAATIECYFAPEDEVEREIIAEVAAAGRRIDFMAFSFTSTPIAEAMAARLQACVRVRGLFEARNAGNRSSRDDFLAERGADIRMDKNPYNLHHKVIIIDDAVVVAGSYNFSKNAETKNDENVLIVHDPGVARLYTEEFERLLQ